MKERRSLDIRFASAENLGRTNSIESIEDSEDRYQLIPIPGFVIKTKKSTGEKVFVNVCEHPDVPNLTISMGTVKTNVKWPIILSSAPRMEKLENKSSGKDGATKEEDYCIFDVVVSPSVLRMSTADETLGTRDVVICPLIRYFNHMLLLSNASLSFALFIPITHSCAIEC